MNATELFRAGDLAGAVDAQLKAVKAAPADANKRFFLFELLCFAGDLDRARRQADAIRYDDPKQSAAFASYQRLLDAEEARRRLFREGLAPRFFGEPSDHVHVRLEAVNRLREGRHAEAAELLAKANQLTPAVAGKLNERPFTELRDADDLFSGVLEVLGHGGYFWVPIEQVRALTMVDPKHPRDLLWVPARLEMPDTAGDVFLPALYPNSHEHPDPQVKLGRATDWKQAEGGPVLGAGLRTFLVGEDALSLLEWRTFEAAEMEPIEESPSAPSAPNA